MTPTLDSNVTNIDLFWYYLSAISSLLVMIINSILLLHFIHDHYASKRKMDTISKYLTISYFAVGILTAICYGFIRTNIFIPYIINMTSIQCSIGYFGSYTFRFFEKAILYYIWTRRIQKVFNQTSYDYSSRFYKFLYYFWLPLTFIPALFMFIIERNIALSQHLMYWILHYHPSSGIIYCISSPYFNIITLCIYIWIILVDSITQGFIVYAFIRNLKALQSDLILQHIQDIETRTEPNNIDKDKGKKLSPLEIVTKNVKNGKINEQSVQRLMKLLKLSRKQTILACIQIISSFLFFLLNIFITMISLQYSLDILVNSICVWLSTSGATKYWNFGSKYCCCAVCYYQINQIDGVKEDMSNGNDINQVHVSTTKSSTSTTQ